MFRKLSKYYPFCARLMDRALHRKHCLACWKRVLRDLTLDYKLVYRDPLPTWVSKHGRTVLAGDSAHPHVPTAQQVITARTMLIEGSESSN